MQTNNISKRNKSRKNKPNSGDYVSTAKDVLKAAASVKQTANELKNIARSVRSNPKGIAKTAAKAMASSAIRSFLGMGDYTSNKVPLHYNSLINPSPSSVTGAHVLNEGRRGTRFRQREYITDILSGPAGAPSTFFNNETFVVNPTNTTLFPWLSNIAPLFDQWEPNGIIFFYKSTSSEYNGSSQALGTVIFAADYDQADPPFATKMEMNASDYAVDAKASSDMAFGIECDPNERPTALLFTQHSTGTSLTSKNWANLCTLQVATQGMSVAGVTLGELWIEYDITFYKKQLPAVSLIEDLQTTFKFNTGVQQDSSFGVGSPTITGALPAYIEHVGADDYVMFFPGPARYMITSQIYITGPSSTPVIGIFDTASYDGLTVAANDAQAFCAFVSGQCVTQVTSFTVSGSTGSASFQICPVELLGHRTFTVTPVSAGLMLNCVV